MMKRLHRILVFLVILSEIAWSQSTTLEDLMESDESENASVLLEIIEDLTQHPIDLNRADRSGIEVIPFITPKQAGQIIENRNNRGPFRSWQDFMDRCVFIRELEEELEPLITFSVKRKEPLLHYRVRVNETFPRSRGFSEEHYPGSPAKIFHRIKIRPAFGWQAGFVTEKDAGEKQMADHWAGSLSLKPDPRIDITLGHFLIQTGQGLVLSGPYGNAKSTHPILTVTKRPGLKGYTFSDENHDFLGSACQLRFAGVLLQIIYSQSPRDAVLTETGEIDSMPVTGYHRTEGEWNQRNRITETLIGLHAETSGRFGLIGVTGWRNRFDKPFVIDGTEDFYESEGSRRQILGMNWEKPVRDWTCFGEMAIEADHQKAAIIGATLEREVFKLALLFRHYDPGFSNPHGMGFGLESPSNKRGWYWGYTTKITSSLNLSAFADLSKNLWMTSRDPLPGWNSDWMVELSGKGPSRVSWTCRARIKNTQENTEIATGDREVNWSRPVIRTQWRGDIMMHPSKNLRIRTRLETVKLVRKALSTPLPLDEQSEQGWLLSHEIGINPVKRWKLSARWTTFETKSWDSRLYLYEQDVPGQYALVSLYDRGNRQYLLLQGPLCSWITVYLKWSQSWFDAVSSRGSGWDEIRGDTIHQIHCQMDVQL